MIQSPIMSALIKNKITVNSKPKVIDEESVQFNAENSMNFHQIPLKTVQRTLKKNHKDSYIFTRITTVPLLYPLSNLLTSTA